MGPDNEKILVCLLIALLLVHVEASAQVSGTMVSQAPFDVSSTDALCNVLAANRGGPDYVRVESNLFSTPPEGFGISIGRRGGLLVSETIAAAVSSVRSGRFYVEMSSSVTTGFAIANPGSQPATVHVFVTSQTGVRSFDTTVTIGAGRLSTAILDNSDNASDLVLRGTMTFESSEPVFATAVRYLVNERSDGIITTLPIVPLTSAIPENLTFPHYAEGTGWRTEFVLINPTDLAISGTVQLLRPDGLPETLRMGDEFVSSFAYNILPRASQSFFTSESGQGIQTGSARVIPSPGSAVPGGVARFTFTSAGVTTTDATAPAMSGDTSFRTVVQISGTTGAGIAIANTAAEKSAVQLELTTADGFSRSAVIELPGFGQRAFSLEDLAEFALLPRPFTGVLQIAAERPIAVTTLRMRITERGDVLMNAVPATARSSDVADANRVLPYLWPAAGSDAQLVLYSGGPGRSSGTLSFVDLPGRPITYSVSQCCDCAPQ